MKGDQDEQALRCAARLSSGRDLVEEFIACGVWPLGHGWVLGEIIPRRMPNLEDKLVQSSAFAVDLRGRDVAAFVREVDVGGLRLPKVLKNMINNVFQVKYMHWNLRIQNEDVHNMESMIGMKVDVVPKLHARELRLNGRNRNRLKGEKAI
jgi:hypothetical protein